MGMLSSLFQRSARRNAYINLLNLDDRLLRDIGLSRGEVHQALRSRALPSRARAHE